MMVMNGKMSVTNDQSGCIKTTCGWIIGYRKENVWLTVIVDARDLQKLFDSGRQLLVGFFFLRLHWHILLHFIENSSVNSLVFTCMDVAENRDSHLTSSVAY